MGDQPVTRAEFDGLHTAAKALLDQMVALTAKIGNINNNNRNYDDKNNQNRRCGPIRVRGRNNQIIEDSNFSMVEKTDFEEIMSNHWKKLQILREQATSAKSIEKDHKALKAKVDEDEVKPEGENLRQQGGLSANTPQAEKHKEVQGIFEVSSQTPICESQIVNSTSITTNQENPKELISSLYPLNSHPKSHSFTDTSSFFFDPFMSGDDETKESQGADTFDVDSISEINMEIEKPTLLDRQIPTKAFSSFVPQHLGEVKFQFLSHNTIGGTAQSVLLNFDSLRCYDPGGFLVTLSSCFQNQTSPSNLQCLSEVKFKPFSSNHLIALPPKPPDRSVAAANSKVNFNSAVDADSNFVVLLKLACSEVPSDTTSNHYSCLLQAPPPTSVQPYGMKWKPRLCFNQLIIIKRNKVMGGICSRKRNQQVIEDDRQRGVSRRYCRSGSTKWLGARSFKAKHSLGGGTCPSLMDLCIKKIREDFHKYESFLILPRDISQLIFNELVDSHCLTETSLYAFRDCALQNVYLGEYLGVNDGWEDVIVSQGPSLLVVDVSGSNVTDHGLRLLNDCLHLQALTLNYCDQFLEHGLKHLSGLSNLTSLSIRMSCTITPDGMHAFSNLVNLEKLDFEWCSDIHGGFVHFKGLKKPESLNIGCCKCVTGSDMKVISGFINLKELQIYNSSITDLGIFYLRGLQKLSTLNVERCNITAARSGRTGRTCDGQVYRLVPGSFYNDLEYHESPIILKLSLRLQKISSSCVGSKAINDPKVLLQKTLDPPNPQIVEDALSLHVQMGALEKTPTRGQYEPTFYGQLLASFLLSFDSSVLVLKFGDGGVKWIK
jgi:hypothetical protein